MLNFTDDQLDMLRRFVAPTAPPERGRFLEAVAAKLVERPEMLGDAHLHHIAVGAQRGFLPALAVGVRPRAAGKYR